ncbi:MAG: hypothetical protein HFI68_09395 [Lachnospiraceae bacterium]|nr:hypothetical protein [Lachnospiraceae bacterium]
MENWFGYGKEKLYVVSTCNLSHYNQCVMVESGCVLVWRKSVVLSPAILRFIEHVKKYLAETEKQAL